MEPSFDIQTAIVAVLKNDSALASIIDGRVYDFVPDKPAFPYVTLGDGQVIGDLADGMDGREVYIQIDIWSRAVGYPETKRIAGLIADAINESNLSLSDNRLLSLQFDGCRYLRDPDGVTRHAAITFRALTDPL